MKRIFKSVVSLALVAVLLCGAFPAGAFTASAATGSGLHVSVAETHIRATKDVSLTLPFNSDGTAGNTTRVAQEAGHIVKAFAIEASGYYGYYAVGTKTSWAIGDTMAYCIEPGVLTGYDVDYTGTTDGSSSGFFEQLSLSAETNSEHEAILAGIYRMNAIADAYNTAKDVDVQATAGIILWELLGGIRDPLTGYLKSGKTSLQSSFTNTASASAYNTVYTQLAEQYKAFSKVCSFMYKSAAEAKADPYILEYNATNKRYEITLTDTTGMLTSMASIPAALNNHVSVSRSGNQVTLYTTEAINGTVVSKRIDKKSSYTLVQPSANSCIVYGGKQLNGGYAQALVSNGTPDPASGYLAVRTGDKPYVDVSGIKTWNDDGDSRGWRPTSITVRLWADGVEVNYQTVTEDDNWESIRCVEL